MTAPTNKQPSKEDRQAFSRVISDLCNTLSDHWYDCQNEIVDNNGLLVMVQPFVAAQTPYAWIVWIYEDGNWVGYPLVREFRTSHMMYAKNSSDLNDAETHEIHESLEFFRWLVKQIESAKEPA